VEFIGFLVVEFLVLLVACVAGAILLGLVALYSRGVPGGRGKALILAFFLPVFVVLYLEGGYFLYGLNEDISGGDSFLEGIYRYPLVDGYRLEIMDKMPEQAGIDRIGRPGLSVTEVREFEVFQKTILVTAHNDPSGDDWGPDKAADKFLMIDTNNSSVETFSSMGELEAAAASHGIPLHLTTVDSALSDAVHNAQPGWLFIGLICAPIVIVLAWLVLRLRRLRHAR
jgi:hypothetical protein